MKQATGYANFKEEVDLTFDRICRDLLAANKKTIQIKNPEVATRNLLLITKATIKLSNAKGFGNMSMRDLSRESGLSMGALYTYFPHKSDIINLLQKQGKILITDVMHDRVDPVADLQERLYMAIRTHLYLSESLKEWFVFFFMEAKNLTLKNRQLPVKLEMETEQIFADILKRIKLQKIGVIDDIYMISAMIKALMQDWYLKPWKYGKRRIQVDEYANFVIRVTEATCGFKKIEI